MEKEVWKDVIVWYKGEKLDYTGLYVVSNLGNIKSKNRRTYFIRKGKPQNIFYPGRILKQVNMNGYRYVNLSNHGMKTYYVHRLVLETFVGKCPEGMECCHYNGKRHDNRLKNIRWDTPYNNLVTDQIRLTGKAHSQLISNEDILKVKTLLCQSIKPSIIAHYIEIGKGVVGGIRKDRCECYKNVKWPNIPKNFWEQIGFKKNGLKSNYKIRKLSLQDVVEIKELLYMGRPNVTTIARLYGVNISAISKIKNNHRYWNTGRKLVA